MDKKKIKTLLGAALVITFGVIYLFMGNTGKSETVVTEGFSDTAVQDETVTSAKNTGVPAQNKSEKIYIHVCGQVKKAGVYKFSSVPRVIDAVKAAGGFTSKADRTSINLAEKIEDGTQLLILSKKASQKKKTEKNASQSGKVNLNKASQEELMTLNGIGESKALQILSYREENGRFRKIEDIMNISGIKEGIFNKIKNQIEV